MAYGQTRTLLVHPNEYARCYFCTCSVVWTWSLYIYICGDFCSHTTRPKYRQNALLKFNTRIFITRQLPDKKTISFRLKMYYKSTRVFFFLLLWVQNWQKCLTYPILNHRPTACIAQQHIYEVYWLDTSNIYSGKVLGIFMWTEHLLWI